jgi:hypothetical protein
VNPGMIEDIERQIDDTRVALDRTIRALQFELSPRHQIEEAWRSAKAGTGRGLRAGADWAAANPLSVTVGAIALVAAACMFATQQRRRG